MHFNESSTPKSAQEIAGEQKIRNLLVFQSSDGSFDFDSVEQLRTHLGTAFASVVQGLQPATVFKITVTVGIILLLEEKFEYCRDLWTLIHIKATDYLNSQLGELQRNLMIESARLKVRALDIAQILPPVAAAQPVYSLYNPPQNSAQFAQPVYSNYTPPQNSAQLSRRRKGSNDVKTESGIGGLDAGTWKESGAAVGDKGSTERVVLDTAPMEI